MTTEILDVLLKQRAQGEPFVVATVIETVGSSSAKAGAKLVINREGSVVAGWVGGGCVEYAVCQTALQCLADGATAVIDLDLNSDEVGVGMPCGGSMRVFVEPILPKPTLWIVGHGRVAECLCVLGDLAGFKVAVKDPIADQAHFPAAMQLISDDIDFSDLQILPGDFIIIATQHKGDHGLMKKSLHSKAGSIALIASRKRAQLILDYLHQEGFSDANLARVMTPAGLDLGARTPEEIALSVISEIVMIRRNGTGRRMRNLA